MLLLALCCCLHTHDTPACVLRRAACTPITTLRSTHLQQLVLLVLGACLSGGRSSLAPEQPCVYGRMCRVSKRTVKGWFDRDRGVNSATRGRV